MTESHSSDPRVPARHAHPVAASAAVLSEHSDDRWSRWTSSHAQRDNVARRSWWIVAGVIGAGLVGWSIVTQLSGLS